MSLFWKKKKPALYYDPETQQPAVRKSICTGEMTVGFTDKATGKFQDYQRVNSLEELERFFQKYGIKAEEVKTIY